MVVELAVIATLIIADDLHPGLAGLLALFVVMISAVGLRGPVRRHGVFASLVFGVCAFVAVLLIEILILDSTYHIGDARIFLIQTVFGISVIGIGAWLASSWNFGRAIEPVALVAVAALLAAVSLQGLTALTALIDTRPTDGVGVLFVSDPTVPLIWSVAATAADTPSMIGLSPYGPMLDMEISVTPGAPETTVRWALLLSGATRLDPKLNWGFDHLDREDDRLSKTRFGMIENSGPNRQVIVGETQSGIPARFGGYASAPFAVTSASRAVVSVPTFRRWPSASLSDSERAALTAALGASPKAPDTLDIEFDGGKVSPLHAVIHASPPLTDPARLLWKASRALQGITYVVFDQQADDVARNGLFVIAILLGTAASCLVAAMQSALFPRPSATTAPEPVFGSPAADGKSPEGRQRR